MPAFFLDEDVSALLGDLLRSHGYHVTDAHDERREGIRDPWQILAGDRETTIATHNRRDFVLLPDALLIWSHEWLVDRGHSSILVLDRIAAGGTASHRESDP